MTRSSERGPTKRIRGTRGGVPNGPSAASMRPLMVRPGVVRALAQSVRGVRVAAADALRFVKCPAGRRAVGVPQRRGVDGTRGDERRVGPVTSNPERAHWQYPADGQQPLRGPWRSTRRGGEPEDRTDIAAVASGQPATQSAEIDKRLRRVRRPRSQWADRRRDPRKRAPADQHPATAATSHRSNRARCDAAWTGSSANGQRNRASTLRDHGPVRAGSSGARATAWVADCR
jgi:hypothetical protein